MAIEADTRQDSALQDRLLAAVGGMEQFAATGIGARTRLRGRRSARLPRPCTGSKRRVRPDRQRRHRRASRGMDQQIHPPLDGLSGGRCAHGQSNGDGASPLPRPTQGRREQWVCYSASSACIAGTTTMRATEGRKFSKEICTRCGRRSGVTDIVIKLKMLWLYRADPPHGASDRNAERRLQLADIEHHPAPLRA